MKRYNNIGELLQELRLNLSKTQCEMAEFIGVEDRTYRRWEKNRNNIADGNIQDIADKTRVPFEVLLRLNCDYPTLYNIATRRYSLCPFDRDYVNKKILQHELFDNKEIGRITPFIKHPDFVKTKSVDFPIYPYKKNIDTELLWTAATEFPELNIRITDPKGYYSGHIVTIPLKIEKYNELREGKIAEFNLKSNDVAFLQADEPVALHILSFFATATTYVYCLAKRLIYFLLASIPNKLSDESIISRYAVTNDGAEFCRKLGMELVRWGYEDYQNLEVEVVPHFFELKINKIEWLENYKKKIGKI